MKKYFSFLLIIISAAVFPQTREDSAGSSNPLLGKINDVISDPFFTPAQIAIDVYDLNTQQTLFAKNEKLLFRPASNLKILTSVAGLLFLGPDYYFTTKLYHTGYIQDSTLFGDLYIGGGFDPLFSTDDIDTLIIGLKQAGVKNITGGIYADVSAKDSLFWGAGWMWDDDPSSDAPYLSSLNINENVVKVVYARSLINTPINIKLIPESGYYTLKNSAVTISGDSSNVKADRDWMDRKNNIIVSGYLNYSAQPDTEEINIYNPPKYFLNLFRRKLFENHILFNGNMDTLSTPAGSNLIGLYKRPYNNVLMPMNKESDNLDAEMTLYALAEKYFGNPASAKNGITLVDSLITLAGFDPTEYRIVDGSGVSHYNLISSELILGVLKYLYYQRPDIFQEFYNSLPIAGIDGTLKKRMVDGPAQNNLRGKTGTISGVSCLSGYVTAKNGHNLAFSIMVQNYVTKAKVAERFIDEICNILAGIN